MRLGRHSAGHMQKVPCRTWVAGPMQCAQRCGAAAALTGCTGLLPGASIQHIPPLAGAPLIVLPVPSTYAPRSWPSCPSRPAAWRAACASRSRWAIAVCWAGSLLSVGYVGLRMQCRQGACAFPRHAQVLAVQAAWRHKRSWLLPRATNQPGHLFPLPCSSLLQGEMVQAKFGVPSVALRQLEVFSSAVLTATLQVGVGVWVE